MPISAIIGTGLGSTQKWTAAPWLAPATWKRDVGFGAEHFIANTFSLSGEVGGRYHAVSYSDEGFSLKGNLAMTYAGASLNFYL